MPMKRDAHSKEPTRTILLQLLTLLILLIPLLLPLLLLLLVELLERMTLQCESKKPMCCLDPLATRVAAGQLRFLHLPDSNLLQWTISSILSWA